MKVNFSFLCILLILIASCRKKDYIDEIFLGVDDKFSYSFAVQNLERVNGVDVEMFSLKKQEDFIVLYTFFKDEIYSKKWIYYVKEDTDFLHYFPSDFLCKKNNCNRRLQDGESVLFRNYSNNQYYSCILDKEDERMNLRILYLFKT